MARVSQMMRRKRPGPPGEPAVVYRGIKIAPIAGKRSKTAKAIRAALQAKSEQSSGPGHA